MKRCHLALRRWQRLTETGPPCASVQVVSQADLGTSGDTMSSSHDDNEVDVVIAVMGMTGSGKSSFIQRVSQKQSTAVGHGLESGKAAKRPLKHG